MSEPLSAEYMKRRAAAIAECKAEKPIKAKQIIAGPKLLATTPLKSMAKFWPTPPKVKPSTPMHKGDLRKMFEESVDGLRFHQFDDAHGFRTYATRTVVCYGMAMTVVCAKYPAD